MSATTEWSRIVDQTVAGLRIEQRTGAAGIRRQLRPARSPQCRRRHERFTLREVWRPAGQFKMATLLQSDAIAIDRSRREIGVDLANFIER